MAQLSDKGPVPPNLRGSWKSQGGLKILEELLNETGRDTRMYRLIDGYINREEDINN